MAIRFFYFANKDEYNSFFSRSENIVNNDYLYAVGAEGLLYKGNELIAQTGLNLFNQIAETIEKMQATDIAQDQAITAVQGTLEGYDDLINLKVDKEDGKGLSEQNFTLEEKQKLAGIEANANKFSITIDSILDSSSTNPVQNKVVKSALDGKVSTGRKINNKTLTSDISLNATDVGADATGTAASAVSAHNKDTTAHTDMQNRINANTNNLSTLSGTVSTHTGNENIHLSDDDRNKLNTAYYYAIQPHASKAFTNVTVGTTTISADSANDTFSLKAGDGVSISANANDNTITISSLDGVTSITEGSTNGTINVDGNDVKVKGLGSIAYEDATTFSTNLKTAVKAEVKTDLVDPHTTNTNVHISSDDRTKWNTASTNLSNHIASGGIHVADGEKTKWNNAYSHSTSTHAPTNAQKNQNAYSKILVQESISTFAGAPTDGSGNSELSAGAESSTFALKNNDGLILYSVSDNVGNTEVDEIYIDVNTAPIVAEAASEAKTYADSTFSKIGHDHNSSYYTKSEVNSKLNEKANSTHTHKVSEVTYDGPVGNILVNNKTLDENLIALESAVESQGYEINSKVPTSRTINGKALTGNISLSASDVGASATGHTHSEYVNQNAFGKVAVGSTIISADSTIDTLTFVAGDGITLTPDATNDKVTITNSGIKTVTAGSSNGTISVNGTDISVKGLGSAAYTASSAYDAAGTAANKASIVETNAKSYTDTKIAALIDDAPETLNTLKELATAINEDQSIMDSLNTAVGKKANASDLTAHTDNKSNPHGITPSQIGAVATNGNALITSPSGDTPLTLRSADGGSYLGLQNKDGTILGYFGSESDQKPMFYTNKNNYLLHNNNFTSYVTPASIGAAADSHGTHVSFDDTNKPKMDGTAAFGTSISVARADHVHPTDTSRASQSDLTSLTTTVSGKADKSTTYTKTEVDTALSGKQASITGAATTVTGSNLTASKALVSNSSGKIAASSVTAIELGYVSGVTGSIQTQLNGKSATGHGHDPATTSAAGFMSKEDKTKLDGITASADSVSFSRSYNSGTKLGTITINGTDTDFYMPIDKDTHYSSSNAVASSATGTQLGSSASASNGNVHLNHFENNSTTPTSSHKITGSGRTSVTATGTTITISTPEYSVATSDENGLVNKDWVDKIKGIGDPANIVYTTLESKNLVAASGTTAGIVHSNSSNVTEEFSVCPISDGKVYYKDTNTTYSAGTGISISSGAIANTGVRSIAKGSTNGTISVDTGGTSAEVAVAGLGSAAYTNSTEYATSGHNHDSAYLGKSAKASSASSADVATKLGSSTLGGSTQPIYLKSGEPTAIGYTIQTSVPSGAVFTDTKVTQTNTTENAAYRVLLSGNANDTTETTTARKSTNLTFNPSTGELKATKLSIGGGATLSWDSSAGALVISFS